MADFEKVGLLTQKEGRILLCRKNHATSKLILPGGRIEPGETPKECLTREIAEELGGVGVTDLGWLGDYNDYAHFDDPTIKKRLYIKLFKGALVGVPSPSNEIIELVWFGPMSDQTELTPIFTNKILPDLLARHILNW